MIQLLSTKEGEAAVLRVSGRIDAATAPGFEQACRDVLAAGEKILILDFGELQYISSAGLRSLLVIGKTLAERGGGLRIAKTTGVVAQVFELSGFYSLFSCFDSVEKAAS